MYVRCRRSLEAGAAGGLRVCSGAALPERRVARPASEIRRTRHLEEARCTVAAHSFITQSLRQEQIGVAAAAMV